jgi:pimeloyl-ACP methyl ester carboxylesterase
MMSFGPAHALYFGPAVRPLFGWYHPAARADGDVAREGLVLCSSIGREDLNAHRTLRHLANAAAQHGVPALRFDYDGCGDSAGDDLDPLRVQAWISSIDAAIDELRARAGVERVCLFGIRMGVLLASAAAARRNDVSSLVAFAPVVSGRAFVREWRTMGLVREWKSATEADGAPSDDTADDLHEAAGFVMTRETREELSRIDLTALPRPAAEVLLVDRDDLPRRDRWATQLGARGAQVKHKVLPGYLGMMSEPHSTQVPQEVVAAVLDWLSRPSPAASRGPAAAPAEVVATPVRISAAVRETPVQIDDEGQQFAILSEPLSDVSDPRGRRALIIINSGACHHIGPNRMYVPLARQFAARGWTVLRVDVSGLGDSEPHHGQPQNAPYTSLAQRDIASWLGYLQQRGIGESHLLGICSGAYHGFKAAVATRPLASVVAINPLVFFWRDGMPLDPPLGDHRVVRLATLYKRSAFDPAKWRKLLSGGVDLRQLARVMERRVLVRARSAARAIARSLGVRLHDDLVAELRGVEKRGPRLDFIFSDADPGFGILREQAGALVDRMTRNRRLSMSMLPGTDHTFSTLAARRALLAELEARLSGPTAATVGEPLSVVDQTMASA